MRIVETKLLRIGGEDGSILEMYRDNMGEPYRQGVTISITRSYSNGAAVFVEDREVDELIKGLQSLRKMR